MAVVWDMCGANKERVVKDDGGIKPRDSVVTGSTGLARCVGSRYVRVSQPCASVGLQITHSWVRGTNALSSRRNLSWSFPEVQRAVFVRVSWRCASVGADLSGCVEMSRCRAGET
jgi:hypothetical protein